MKTGGRGSVVLAAAIAAFTWTTGGAAAAEAAKIGTVNIAKIFDGYQKTKQSDAVLEKKGKQKEAEYEGRLGELRKLREGLELLNDQSRQAKEREIEEKADALKRFRGNTAEDLRRERNQIAQGLLSEIQQGVQQYAKANGFTLIIDERAVLYGQETIDVTDEVLTQLNAAVKP
jgi:outer membrane protein